MSVEQPPSASTRSFIPVNMHRFLWKGLIQRLFRGIMSGFYRLPISGDKGVAQKHERSGRRDNCVFMNTDCSLWKKKWMMRISSQASVPNFRAGGLLDSTTCHSDLWQKTDHLLLCPLFAFVFWKYRSFQKLDLVVRAISTKKTTVWYKLLTPTNQSVINDHSLLND